MVLTKEGTYYAGVTDAKGCNSKDTVVLTVQNTVINNEFALPTQVYQREQIVVVNTSNPQPDSLKWVLPPEAVITQQNNKYAAFTLANTGAYFVRLIVWRGRCYAEETKKVIVLTPHNLNSIGVAPEPFIQTFTAVPNPNNGNFLVRVVLKSKADMQLRLINTVTGQTVISQHLSGSDSYSIPVNVSVNPGVYVVVVETPNGNASLKLIIF